MARGKEISVDAVPSVCGIDCSICDQFLDRQCAGCLKNESIQKTCEAYLCAAKSGLKECFKCQRVKYCSKRRRAIEKCIVLHPRFEFQRGITYLMEEEPEATFLTFAKHVFGGSSGLLLTERDTAAIKQKYLLQDVHSLKSVEDLEAKVKDFIQKNKTGIILVDSLSRLIKDGTLGSVVDALRKLSDEVISSGSTLLLIAGDTDSEQKKAVKDQISDLRIDYVIKSVSNPKRKEILNFLRHVGKSSFADIYRSLGYNVPPKLSFHLKVLRESGVIEQDARGIYYISGLGREIDRMLKKIGNLAVKEKRLEHRPMPDRKRISRYRWYPEVMRKRGNYRTVEMINSVERSVEIIVGKKKADEILRTVLSDYVETERDMSDEDLKRMVSEITFVFLVDVVPLGDAIEWADELIVKHGLK